MQHVLTYDETTIVYDVHVDARRFLLRLIVDPEDGDHTMLRNMVHMRTARRYISRAIKYTQITVMKQVQRMDVCSI
jgi:hypothetical protein